MISHLDALCASRQWNSDLSNQEIISKNTSQTLENQLEHRKLNLAYLEKICEEKLSKEKTLSTRADFSDYSKDCLTTLELTTLSEVALSTPRTKTEEDSKWDLLVISSPQARKGEDFNWDLCEINLKNTEKNINKDEWVKL